MRRILACVAMVALLGAACGGGMDASEDPKGALVEALEALGDADGQSVTLTLEADAEDLAAAMGNGAAPADARTAEKVLGSSLSISGNNADDPKDSRASFVLSIAGTDALELRGIGTTLYARADVPHLAETFGADPAVIERGVQQARQQPGFEFLGAAVEGKWIAVRGFEELAKQMGTSPNRITAQQRKFYEDFARSVEKSATVTHAGADDPGEHLVVSIPVRAIYRAFRDFAGAVGTFPLGAGTLPEESQVPEGDLEIDAWVDDGTLTQVEFDLVKNAAVLGEKSLSGAERVALRLAFEEFDGEVDEPDAAAEVDARQLFQAFLGGMGAQQESAGTSQTIEGSHGGGIDCDQFKGAPPEVIEAVKAECPELAKD